MRASGSNAPIRVLVVEDSPAQRILLVGILQTAPDFVVVGTARNGVEAVATAERLRPDIVAMDIILPGLDGYGATRQIMQRCPTRVVLISSDAHTTQKSADALSVGALSVVRKPASLDLAAHASDRDAFLQTLRLMAGVPVVTRHSPRVPAPIVAKSDGARPQIVALAASTGGPLAVQTVLRGLGADFPLPILVVQHITRGYTDGLATWLQQTVPLPVQVATQSVALQGGHVYLAPDDQHLLVQSRGIATLRPTAPDDSFCPSADVLFNAVATVYQNRALGVVLTGMGDDGARGLQALAAAGSPTLAQDEASCVVYGMPRAAVAAGAITRSAALTELGSIIRDFAECGSMLATSTTGTL